ncbi:fluoride efflux transporter CrcB [Candidatus Margulisiibacteriota bacterium]
MINVLSIALGGAIGAVLRYFMSNLEYLLTHDVFPFSTLAVNLIGSLLVGFCWGLFDKMYIPSTARLFLFVGLFGGFTTFSSFAIENMHLLRDGKVNIALLNIFATNFFGIAAVFVGFYAAQYMYGVLNS